MAAAERTGSGLGAAIFRLPGIYGPGRSAFDRLREGKARRLVKPGHVFTHPCADDPAAGLAASIGRPHPSRVYNLCDDAPTGPDEVTAYAARLLGMEPPPEEAFDASSLSPMARRFWRSPRRVERAGQGRAGMATGPSLTYREGLEAVLAAEFPSASSGCRRSEDPRTTSPVTPAGSAPWPRAMKLANSGCGSKGRLFSSGWNWTPTNHGWSSRSTISGSTPSGDRPQNLRPRALDRLAIADVHLVAVAVALGDGRASRRSRPP